MPTESSDPSEAPDLIELAGSHRQPAPGATRVGPVTSEQPVEVTMRLRGRPGVNWEGLAADPDPDTAAAAFAADPADAAAVVDWAGSAGLAVVAVEPEQRRVVVAGTPDQLRAAFGIELDRYELPDAGSYRGRTGPILLPASLEGVVTGVFGLDDRVQARPHLIRRAAHTITLDAQRATSYTPLQLGTVYGFPAGTDGSGEVIAILEFGGGYDTTDLQSYFHSLRVPMPSVSAVSVDGAVNSPQPGDDSPDGEVMLDIEVAGALAPGASIVVYFAPFTERGWVDVVTKVVTDTVNKPSVLSISWGWPEGEDLWTTAALRAVNETFQAAAAAGITVFAASGDDGSADEIADGRVHVDFPAVSPFVSGVGGTTLKRPEPTVAERVWNNGPRSSGGGASGGGVSEYFRVPTWQAQLDIPNRVGTNGRGRGVPDVAADADPNTGYLVRVHGANGVAGGTSAAAPLWAALTARLNQALGRRVGHLNPLLSTTLAGRGTTHDVATGNNDTTGRLGGYRARTGWDPCTGWGSPNGAALLTALRAPAHAAETEWTLRPGTATVIAAGMDGSVWAVSATPAGGGYGLHRWTGAEWSPLAGAAAHVAVGADGSVYATDLVGRISVLTAGSWQTISGTAYALAVDASGVVWATAPDVGGGFGAYRGTPDGAWTRVGGPVVWVSAAADVVGLDPSGAVYRWSDDSWQPMAGRAMSVVAGADGSLWALGPTWAGDGFEILRYGDGDWVVVPGSAMSLAVDTHGTAWGVTASGAIYTRPA